MEVVSIVTYLYKDDVDFNTTADEIKQFLHFAKEEGAKSAVEMYQLIAVGGLQCTFPNVETFLRIFLTIPISNATGERSFPVVKRIKNYQRNSISQCRVGDLSIYALNQRRHYNTISMRTLTRSRN